MSQQHCKEPEKTDEERKSVCYLKLHCESSCCKIKIKKVNIEYWIFKSKTERNWTHVVVVFTLFCILKKKQCACSLFTICIWSLLNQECISGEFRQSRFWEISKVSRNRGCRGGPGSWWRHVHTHVLVALRREWTQQVSHHVIKSVTWFSLFVSSFLGEYQIAWLVGLLDGWIVVWLFCLLVSKMAGWLAGCFFG